MARAGQTLAQTVATMTPAGAIAAALAAVAGAACSGGAPSGDADAGGVDASGDGGQTSGLELRFAPDPALPSDAGGDFDATITRIKFDFADLRVVGDAAPGDERTRLAVFKVDWPTDGAVAAGFGSAPPGVYSYVLATITEYKIEGTVMLDGETEFQIEDDTALALSLPLDLVLEPGGFLQLDVSVDVDALVRQIRWDEAPIDDGKRKIEGDAELADEVLGSFTGPDGASGPT